MDIWRDIAGYEGLYQVSSSGDVRSISRFVETRMVSGRVLALSNDRRGYQTVRLWKRNKPDTRRVHRLVAETFIPNPLGFHEVNHKNENKKDNSVTNLEWCSRVHNVRWGTGIHRAAEQHKRPVIQIGMDGLTAKVWDSAASASASLLIDDSGIAKAARGKLKSAGGFLWRYA